MTQVCSRPPISEARKKQLLEKALKRRGNSMEIAVRLARAGVYQFHDLPDAVAITQILVRPDGEKQCFIVALGGTFDGAKAMSSVIDRFARDMNCATIQTIGRRGWASVPKHLANDYKPVGVLFEKRL